MTSRSHASMTPCNHVFYLEISIHHESNTPCQQHIMPSKGHFTNPLCCPTAMVTSHHISMKACSHLRPELMTSWLESFMRSPSRTSQAPRCKTLCCQPTRFPCFGGSRHQKLHDGTLQSNMPSKQHAVKTACRQHLMASGLSFCRASTPLSIFSRSSDVTRA